MFRNYSVIVLFLLLSGIWTFIGRRQEKIRRNACLAGGWFGLLGLLANWICFEDPGLNFSVSFRSIPPILAAFFFHPLAGLISGGCAIAGKVGDTLCQTHFGSTFWDLEWDARTLPWQICVLAILLTAGYAAGMAQWIFERKRPPFIVAAIAAAYGIILYFSVVMLLALWQKDVPQALLVLDVSYPVLPITAGLATGLAALICTGRKKWRGDFFAPLTWGFLLFGITFAILTKVAVVRGYDKTDKILKAADAGLQSQIGDQITILLHHRAVSLKKQLEKETVFSMAVMQRLAKLYEVDEVNLFEPCNDQKVRLLGTDNPDVQKYNETHHELGVLREFLPLTQGTQDLIKSGFRASRSNAGIAAKYIGLPFQDRRAFLQLGYYKERLEKDFATFFFPTFDQAKVDEHGCFIITNRSGLVVTEVAGHPEAKGKNLSTLCKYGDLQHLQVPGILEVSIFGVYGRIIRCQDIGQWRIYAFLPYQDVFDDVLILIMLGGFLLFVIGIVIRLVDLHAARMRQKLDEMRETDLRLAATIQNSELQQGGLMTSDCRVTAAMTPAKEVGGDFYDYYELPDGRIAVTVADVSGKGVPAAFFMIKAKNLLKNELLKGDSPAEVAERVNHVLNRNNDAFMFVTAWFGLYHPAAGVLEYVSAGHNPPLIRHAGGSVEFLAPARRQKPLAAFPLARYQSEKIMLSPGDQLFLYTDGVTEAMNKKGELFGTDRLKKTLQMTADGLIMNVNRELKIFTAGAPQADDITMLTMEVYHK